MRRALLILFAMLFGSCELCPAQTPADWPAPCARDNACVLVNDVAGGTITFIEWRAGGNLCETVRAWKSPKGGWRGLRWWHWPHPGDGCWEAGVSKDYDMRPANDEDPAKLTGYGEWSNVVSFGPLDWACWDAHCEVPCAPGLPLRFPKCEGCPGRTSTSTKRSTSSRRPSRRTCAP